MTMTQTLDAFVPRIENWLENQALPFWATEGQDRRSGRFFERVAFDGKRDSSADTRLRVQARQIYVYAHAYQRTGNPAWREAAELGFGFLTRHGWVEEGGGWGHLFSSDGELRDTKRDAYDHAFALFALAWYSRAIDRAAAAPWIERTYNFLEARFSDPENGGYLEALMPVGQNLRLPDKLLPRRQNPHMHLLEGFLALYETGRDKHWLSRARRILDLAQRRFIDPETGTLVEFLSHDWSAPHEAQGHIREPGHHYEWVWLLHEYERLSGDSSLTHLADRFFDWSRDFGTEHRSDRLFGAFDATYPDGRPIMDTKRLWTLTELIKGSVAQYRSGHDELALALSARGLTTLFERYLFAGRPGRPHWQGGWHDRLTPDGSETSTAVPASSFYHIHLAFAEVIKTATGGRSPSPRLASAPLVRSPTS